MTRWLLIFVCFVLLSGLALAVAIDQPPEVHMLVPGFRVQELPLDLPNINNLRFAKDGRLFALAYNGHVYVLNDTNSDGLEDEATLFWDQDTISVPVGMVLAAEGVYVSSHGKVSLLRDTNGDGKADKEDIVASGWPPTDVASGGVDATAITLDQKGNLYFGLIAADYSNPYRVKDGVSHYDLKGKRGTIQRLRRGEKESETIATGIRVPYALAFNANGHLFCTDQEGETWCPNGNPLDELNEIIEGRNYGFPPRHEKWLPSLQSENPIVAFGPQHQSTCGLVFNEPHEGQGLFGPSWWKGQAFIAGESRGKIWRVWLVKTPNGYLGQEFTIARLSMLALDLAISPAGALYVCCHSGPPDWGTGPNGRGKIFKITYFDPKAPQPILISPGDATEVAIMFDKPIDASITNGLVNQKIEFGENVRAGDRFEVLKPPYALVKQQENTPRGKLNIVGARVVQGNAPLNTLVLRTDPHPQPVTYALAIPGVKRRGSLGPGEMVDLDYDLSRPFPPHDVEIALELNDGPTSATLVNTNRVEFPEIAKKSYPYIHSAELEQPFQFSGGDFERGKSLFFSDKLKCSTCHRVRGEGATTGPDLSNLISRDAASVLRDIKDPGASIHPDYVAYNVSLRNGESLTGFVRSQDADWLRLTTADGKETKIRRSEVSQLLPSAVSLMPSGLLESAKQMEVEDLLTFLLNGPPERDPAEVRQAVNDNAAAGFSHPIRIVLVASKQDHGPDQHDYPRWQKDWHALLNQATNALIEDAWLWPTAEQFEKTDVLAFYYWNHDWTKEKFQQLDEFLKKGRGIVVLHSATIGNPHVEELASRIGLASDSVKTKYQHTPIDLEIVAPANHPIFHALPRKIHFLDEPYWPMIGETNKIDVLATVEREGKQWPMMWTYQKGNGRVFASVFGHYTWTLSDPWFRLVVLRAISWAAGEEVARLEGLALMDAKTGEESSR